MSELKVDTIKDAAGTGAPDFANGLTIAGGASTLSVYEEGTWTPSWSSGVNVTESTSSFSGATYTRIGDTVFWRIEGITGLSVGLATTYPGTFSQVAFTSTGLPGITTGMRHYGNAVLGTNSNTNLITAGVLRASSGNTNIAFTWMAKQNTGTLTVNVVWGMYKIA